MSMTASITKLKYNRTISVHLSNEIINLLKTRTIVVRERLGEIFIRPSSIDDAKTYAISKRSNSFSYTVENSNDFIGKYNAEEDGAYIVLYRP